MLRLVVIFFALTLSSTLSSAEITIKQAAHNSSLKQVVGRPKIGLALGGGGAKGSAHIGVIRVLEELNIPIDYVAGTSMGAYVAGMVAMGLSADEIEQRMFATDWMSGYSDKIERSELSYRNKKQRDRFQINTDLGLDGTEVKLPSGYIQGETMAKLLRQSTQNLPNFDNFDDMPVPLRTVALDLGAMKPYVFKSGNLVTAMQASMSVPGALKPVEHDGKLLADGGIVNNLPIDVLKDMGADIVIAVDIGSDLAAQEDLDSYLAIAGQLITHMTNTSTREQIAKMSARDILIKPAVSHIGTGAFDRIKEGLPLGYQAAQSMREQLAQLSLDTQQYQTYIAKRNTKRNGWPKGDIFIADKIEIVSNSRLDKRFIRSALGVKTGEPYSLESLEKNVRKLYAQNLYERVDYEFEQRDSDNVLVVHVREKSWGPGYIDMLFSIEESLDNNTDFALGASYTLTDINSWGGEWRNEFIFGSRTLLSTELYTPLDRYQRFFSSTKVSLHNLDRNFYLDDLNDSSNLEFIQTEYSTLNGRTELGWNILPEAIAAFGYGAVRGNIDLVGFSDELDFTSHGPYVRLGYDTLDNIYFPTSGQALEFKISSLNERYENLEDTNNSGEIQWLGAHNWGNHSLALNLQAGGTNSELELPTVVQDLGGYRNLSGYNRNEISGRYKAYGSILYNYRLAQNDFGAFQFPTYLGLSLERGNVWNERDDIDLGDTISAGSISLGVDSNIGPVIFAYGRTNTGKESVYLFLGSIF